MPVAPISPAPPSAPTGVLNADSFLANISPSGKAPPTRVKDARSAREIVERLWIGGQARRLRWAQVDRMADGQPPYDQRLLDANGQSYRSNTPTNDGGAILSSANTTYYDLLSASRHVWEIELDVDDGRKVEVSRVLSEEVDDLVKAWPNWYHRMWMMITDFIRHGRGLLMWPRSGWKFYSVRYHRVLVNDGAEADLDTLDRLVVLQKVGVTHLYNQIRTGGGQAIGWNKNAVMDSIRRAAPDTRQLSRDPVEVEMAMRDNDMWMDAQSSEILLAHLFVKEFDQTWSHYVIDRRATDNTFLFARRSYYKDLCDFACPFFFEILDGSWNGAYGLGKMIYPVIRHSDRIWNTLLDGVYVRSAINLQAQDASALRRLSQVQMGGQINVFPPGFEALQSGMLGDLSSALAVSQESRNMLERNTGVYRSNLQQQRGNPRTAEEVKREYAQATVLSSSAVDRWYIQQDRCGATIWNRMKQDPKIVAELLERLAPLGVTRKELLGECEVRSVRAIGNGSYAARQDAIEGFAPFVGSLPEAGRQRWMNDMIATRAGQSNVERWNPTGPDRTSPTAQEWEATEENGTLVAGIPVVRYGMQNDYIHAQVHLKFMGSAAQHLSEGAPMEKVLGTLEAIGPHLQVHLAALATDRLRAEEVKQMQAAWKRLAGLADTLRRRLKVQLEHQAQQAAESAAATQPPTEAQIKLQEAQARIGIEQQKVQADIAMANQKHQAEMRNAAERTAADIPMRKAQTMVNLQEDLATRRKGEQSKS